MNEGLFVSCEVWYKYRIFFFCLFFWWIIDMKSFFKWWGDFRYCFDKNIIIFWDVCKYFKLVFVLLIIRLVWIFGFFFFSWYNKLVVRERLFWLILIIMWFLDWFSGGIENEDFFFMLFVFILYELNIFFFLILDIFLKLNRVIWKLI